MLVYLEKGSRDVADWSKGIKAGEGSKHRGQELGGNQGVWLLFSMKY